MTPRMPAPPPRPAADPTRLLPGQPWGPLPRLVHLLDSAPPGRGRVEPDGWQAAERFGGLWAMISSADWPEAPDRPPSRLRTRLERFWKRQGTATRTEMIRQMVACHAWLGARNLQAAVRWFSPLWQSCPVELTRLTGRGVACAALASRLDPNRRPAEWKKAARLAASLPALDEAATVGDCLALHLALESLVERAGRHFRAGSPDGSERCGGGLRSTRFLVLYPDLLVRSRSLGCGRWMDATRPLFARSPLTLAVYPDILGEAGSEVFLGPLSRPGRHGPSQTRWGDRWLALLARSVVGAILSPPPAHEQVIHLEEELQRVLNRAVRKTRRRAEPGGDSLVSRAETALTRAREDLARQRRERVAILVRVLGRHPQDPGSPFLALRTLDMLVRSLVASAEKNLRAQWIRAEPELPQDTLARDLLFASPAEVSRLLHRIRGQRGAEAPALFGNSGAGFAAVVDTLFPERWGSEERESLAALLTPPRLGPHPGQPPRTFLESSEGIDLADQADLELQAARRLVERYHGVEVPLPFPPPHDCSLSPGEILDRIRQTVV